MEPADAFARLTALPGMGAWTATSVISISLGAPDTIVLGDFHLPTMVNYAFTGDARRIAPDAGGDALMCRHLEPWSGHRQRIVRLLSTVGVVGPAACAPVDQPRHPTAVTGAASGGGRCCGKVGRCAALIVVSPCSSLRWPERCQRAASAILERCSRSSVPAGCRRGATQHRAGADRAAHVRGADRHDRGTRTRRPAPALALTGLSRRPDPIPAATGCSERRRDIGRR